MRTAGLDLLLDAYVDRVPGAPGTGLTADDIDACDWIVVGHSHFDHLSGAERVMANTNARLIGSYETIRVMERAGVDLDRMICVQGGETVDLGSGVRVSVYPSQHSCVWSHGQMSQSDEVCIGDLGVTLQEQQKRFASLASHLGSLGDEAIRHFTEGSQGARGDGEPIQGSLARFVARQVDLVRPRRVVLCHHDDWLPGFSIPTDVEPIRAEMARVAPKSELLELGYVDGTEILPTR